LIWSARQLDLQSGQLQQQKNAATTNLESNKQKRTTTIEVSFCFQSVSQLPQQPIKFHYFTLTAGKMQKPNDLSLLLEQTKNQFFFFYMLVTLK